MKRKLSLALVLMFVVTLLCSWQSVYADTRYESMKVGQQKRLSLVTSKIVHTGAWYVAGNVRAVKITSQSTFGCTIEALEPTGSNRAIVRCSYYFLEDFAGSTYMRSDYLDYYIDVAPVSPDSVSISPEDLDLVEGDTYKLTAKLSPSGATSDLSWSSSNDTVLEVDSNGRLNAKKAGSATITVKTSNGKSDKVTYTVKEELKGLKLTKTESLVAGESKTLKLEVSPSNAGGFSVSWSSSDTSVVKVSNKSNNGVLLTGVGEGTAEITALANGKTASCTVTVKRPKPTSIEIPEEITILENKTEKLAAKILPAAADKSIEWSSSKEKVATVSEDGTVTGVSEGTTTITAKTSNGLKDKCTVSVVSHLPQDIKVAEIRAKTYGDEGFKVEVTPDEESGLTAFTYSSSNPDVAEIDEGGNVTIKAAGKTKITVSQEGNDTYASFAKSQELVVNKKEITITADAKFKKENEDDPELTYKVTGELVAGDEITGELTRKNGEKKGSYKITIGTLAINDNYDIKFIGAVLEIVDKMPQNIIVAELGEKTYGDESFVIEVAPDEVANLTDYTFESSNGKVAEVAEDGTVTINGVGETNITVKQAGNEEYAVFKKVIKLVVNKKDVAVKAIDFDNETATLEGVLEADTGVVLDFKKLQVENLKVSSGTTSSATAVNLVLTGEKAENYNVTTEKIDIKINKDKVVTVSVTAENGKVEGAGSYLKGTKITIKATADKGYRFNGWYDGKNRVSKNAQYTFVADENIKLTAEFKKSSSGGSSGGGGGGSTGGGGGGGGVSPAPSSHKVNFITNGSGSISSQTVEKDGVAKKPATPEKKGFKFGGWYTDKELTSAYDFDSKVTKSVNLYAKWFDVKNAMILTIGETKTTVFGEEKVNDVAPKLVNSRTMLPVRAVAEGLGAEVIWTAEDMDKVVIKKDKVEIVIRIGSDKAYVNGKEIVLDSPAFLENDRTYMPVRFIAENLGADVDWINDTQEVVIIKK